MPRTATADAPMTAARQEPPPARQRSDARFWDRLARKYARSPIEDQAGYERSLERTREFLTRDDDVLEIGCGTGSTALRHAPHVRHITGTDISPEMIAIANEKLAEDGPANVDFLVATADDPSFANGAYDTVMAHNILHLVPDLDATLSRIRDALRPGGLLIAKTPCLGDMNPAIRWVMLPAMRAVGKAPPVLCFKETALREAIGRNGFVVEAVEFHGTKGRDARPFIVARKA